ncbi:hypothetical protein [Bradyrhizobium sp.]|uniref:hypothetical protein n=1 Tax=Bradyrhizobium sp. TaxID=376 RepID=UPI0039E2A473
MRTLLVIAICFAATTVAAAEGLRLPAPEQPQAGKTLPLKGTAGAAKANSCASYGRGFYMVESTGTCVKVGGSISVDTTIRR